MNQPGPDLQRLFFLDGQTEWTIRGPGCAPGSEAYSLDVEVKRILEPDGRASFVKRFLARADGADRSYWTQRENRFIGYFGGARTPQVVRPARLDFEGEDLARAITQDAGLSLFDWHKLKAGPPGTAAPWRSPFHDPGEVLLLLRACLAALHGIHRLGIVHCDIKAANICLPYVGNPLGEDGIRFDYGRLRLIDFAFAVWPHSSGWELEEPLPIDPDDARADYFSQGFKRILRRDRGRRPPNAWQALNGGMDLYALGVMLRKLLAQRAYAGESAGEPALEAGLRSLAAQWVERYEHGPSDPALPHEGYIEQVEALLRAHRPAWGEWGQSAPFVPREVADLPRPLPVQPAPIRATDQPTPLAPAETAPVLPPQDYAATPLATDEGDSPQGPVPPPKPLWRRWLWAPMLGGLVGGGVWWAGMAGRGPLPGLPKPALIAAEAVAASAGCPAPGLRLEAAGPALSLPSRPLALALSPDGRRLALGLLNGGLLAGDWDSRPFAPRPLARTGGEAVKSLAFSPDGRTVAAGSADGRVRLFDAATGQALGKPLAGHGDTVLAVAFAAEGAALGSIGSDGTVRRWDVRAGQAVGEPMRGFAMRSAAFGPDLALFASGREDGVVGIWNPGIGQSIGEPQPGHAHMVTALAFSPDGSMLVSGGWDQAVRRWDARSGSPIGGALAPHRSGLGAVAFAPDGRRFASADVDGDVRLWDAKTGCLLAEARHPGGVVSLLFAGDGALVSGGYEGWLNVWNIGAGAVAAAP